MRLVAAATPSTGVTSVGDVASTIDPVPVTVLPSSVVLAEYACTDTPMASNVSTSPVAVPFVTPFILPFTVNAANVGELVVAMLCGRLSVIAPAPLVTTT